MKRAMRRQQGFTMIELVTVMVLIGVLAAIGIPRLMGSDSTGTLVFGEQVVNAVRYAHKTAIARRRLVCATLSGKTVRLRMREAPGLPAAGGAACALGIGVSDTEYDSTNNSTVAGGGGFAGAAAVALFFHPDGSITRDAAGTSPVGAADTLQIMDGGVAQRTIRMEGTTGYVQ
ncbi:pilus assembly FimT family protein [Massilia phyllostachyos]|uniref:pilus assembly FimT family protein n=1 Tax=Massilia phyllostachyos TaxID=2898585 RepID=UPI0022AA3227|nr:prepilin-type N-terminal cleavage/methylation domain-containing protein [Massilia phyllostachyos]